MTHQLLIVLQWDQGEKYPATRASSSLCVGTGNIFANDIGRHIVDSGSLTKIFEM